MQKKILAIALFLAACAPTVAPQQLSETTHSNIERYEDEEAGVVCWILHGNKEASISCLPKKDTKLFGR